MNLKPNSSNETVDLCTHEVDLDSTVVNYEFIPKPDLKTILENQLRRNTLAQSNIRSIPRNIEVVDPDLYRPNEQAKRDQGITLSASTLLESAIRRARVLANESGLTN